MVDIISLLSIGTVSFISWFFTNTFFFYYSYKFERIGFLSSYYVALIVINILVYSLFVKFANRDAEPFEIMAYSMLFYFAFQFLVYKYTYRGDLDFLNFWDYMVPMFLTASVIYLVSGFIRS